MISLFNFALSILVDEIYLHIFELLKNVASRDKSDHRVEISATNLVIYNEIEALFEALLNIISTIFKFVLYGYIA